MKRRSRSFQKQTAKVKGSLVEVVKAVFAGLSASERLDPIPREFKAVIRAVNDLRDKAVKAQLAYWQLYSRESFESLRMALWKVYQTAKSKKLNSKDVSQLIRKALINSFTTHIRLNETDFELGTYENWIKEFSYDFSIKNKQRIAPEIAARNAIERLSEYAHESSGLEGAPIKERALRDNAEQFKNRVNLSQLDVMEFSLENCFVQLKSYVDEELVRKKKR